MSSVQLIEQIRERFPGAELIVSTWSTGALPELPGCDVVTSVDPGPYKFNHPDCGKLSNFNYNRMLLSTQAGLARVTREYVLKIRSDTRVLSDGFWDLSDEFESLRPARGLFKRAIVVSSIYSRDPLKSRRLFHPSDMIQFGLVGDLKKFWDARPIKPNAWDNLRPEIEAGRDLLAPEQILTLDLLLRTGWLTPKQAELGPYRKMLLSEELLSTCFIVAEPDQLGVSNADRFAEYSDPQTCYTHETWKSLHACPRGILTRQSRALLFFVHSLLRASHLAVRLGRALSDARR